MSRETIENYRLLSCKTVCQTIGFSRSTLYAQIQCGTFPPPVKIGKNAVAWREADVVAWIQARPTSNESGGE